MWKPISPPILHCLFADLLWAGLTSVWGNQESTAVSPSQRDQKKQCRCYAEQWHAIGQIACIPARVVILHAYIQVVILHAYLHKWVDCTDAPPGSDATPDVPYVVHPLHQPHLPELDWAKKGSPAVLRNVKKCRFARQMEYFTPKGWGIDRIAETKPKNWALQYKQDLVDPLVLAGSVCDEPASRARVGQ